MKSVIKLIGSNIFAQLISFAIMPIIARLYGPDLMGAAGIFAAVSAILCQIATLSYHLAIVLPSDDAEASSITALAISISGIMSLTVLIVLFMDIDNFTTYLGMSNIKNYLWIIPILMVVGSVYGVLDQWANRLSLYSVKAITTSAASILTSFIKITIGLTCPNLLNLILASNMGQLTQSMLMLSHKSLRTALMSSKSSTGPQIKEIASRYRDFAIFRAPEQLLNSVTQGLPVIVFGIFYGSNLTGQLALAIAALNTPANIVGKAIVDVTYPRMSKSLGSVAEFRSILFKSTIMTAALALGPTLVAFNFASDIFGIVFGPEWEQSGNYAEWLVLWTYAMICNRPAMAAIPVLSKQKNLLTYTVISTSVRMLLMLIVHLAYQNALVTIIFYSSVSAVLNILLVLFTYRQVSEQTLKSRLRK